jgi:NitT/TauT family transport system substrate-binding protein
VRIAPSYGIAYLPLVVMEQNRLLEKHARAAGLGDVKVSWVTISGGAGMNDALLSGNVDFVSGGIPPFALLWDRSRGAVKGVAALSAMPIFLNTRNARIRSIRDYTEKDRIALPAVKSSAQAMFLQMAAEQAFGAGQHARLDALTIAMPHPEATAQLLSAKGEIESNFSSPPFQYTQLERGDVRTLLNSYDVLGGPATLFMLWTTAKFRDGNPRTYAAFLAALEEANAFIAGDRRAAADLYLRRSKDKSSIEAILKMLNDPQTQFVATPQNVMKTVVFMHQTGALKARPANWRELFFQEIHGLPGS